MSYIFTTDRTVHVFLILTTTLVREAHFSHSNEVIFSIHTEKCQEEFAFGPLFLCILKINRAARELVPGIQVVVEEACFWGWSQAWGLRPCPKWPREQSSTSVTVSGTEKATEKEVFATGAPTQEMTPGPEVESLCRGPGSKVPRHWSREYRRHTSAVPATSSYQTDFPVLKTY